MNCNTTHYRANSSSVPGDPTSALGLDLKPGSGPKQAGPFRAGYPTAETAGTYWSYHLVSSIAASIGVSVGPRCWDSICAIGPTAATTGRTGGNGAPSHQQAPVVAVFFEGAANDGGLAGWAAAIEGHMAQSGAAAKVVERSDRCSLPPGELLAALAEADVVVSDSCDVLHLARLAGKRSVGVHLTRADYPTRRLLPAPRTVHLVPGPQTRDLNVATRLLWNILEAPGPRIEPSDAARACRFLLDEMRYLGKRGEACRGADALLRQFVAWEDGKPKPSASEVDRHRSFDLVLREIGRRFEAPRVLETGCARYPEDWAGTGYSTYLFGVFLAAFGGSLVSVDLSQDNCEYAARIARGLPVTVVASDSLDYLAGRKDPVDVLYLDSMDVEIEGHERHNLLEMRAALPLLHEASLVVIDDCFMEGTRRAGKGAETVPWLLERGWHLLHDGYQAVLSRQPEGGA